MTRTIGFLHTGAPHVANFDRLMSQHRPEWEVHHEVRNDLLDAARAEGITDAVVQGVQEALRVLVAAGAEQIICTCSTIGSVAETSEVGVPVVRVDRPMAQLAARSGRRVALVMTLASTREPSTELLAEYLGPDQEIVDVLVDLDFGAFERGDIDAYWDPLERAVRDIAPTVDVIVLAQASAAGVSERVRDLEVPVLASPAICIQSLR